MRDAGRRAGVTAFDAARVDRACRRFVDATLAAERGPVDLRRHMDLWDAPTELEVPEGLTRARMKAMQEGATAAARLGSRAVITAGLPNRARRRKEARERHHG